MKERSSSGGTPDDYMISKFDGEDIIQSYREIEKIVDRISKKQIQAAKQTAEEAKKTANNSERKKIEENLQKEIQTIKKSNIKEASKIEYKAELENYKNFNIVEKRQFQEQRARQLKLHLENLNYQKIAELKMAKDASERQKVNAKYLSEKKKIQKFIEDADNKGLRLEKAKTDIAKRNAKYGNVGQLSAIYKERAQQSQSEFNNLAVNRQNELLGATKQEDKDKINADYADKMKTAAKEARIDTLKSAALDIGKAVAAKLENEINSKMSVFYTYQASVNARLQGSETTFQDITKTLKKNLGMSPYLQMTKVVENISKLSAEGIAYNLEQRAFLASISDKIATTFDAADGTLLRLIKLQQADTTAARLGMEAYLTQFLNKMYEDTSYLTQSFDAVSSAILDANSIRSRDDSSEFEFTVQKWLGSLSSVGLSNQAVEKIAEGVNYIGTGNVSAMSSDESLQNLFAMASSRAGLSYGEMFTNNISIGDTNELLKQVILYLQEISSSNNNVVKSEYAKLFGLSISDMAAIRNLAGKDIKEIYNTSMTYDQAYTETQTQLSSVSSRMHIGEKLNNIYENAMTTVSTGIAENAGTFILWKVNDFIEKATGGINLPFITAVGTGVDVNANINQLMKLGLVGASTLGQIGTIVSAVGKSLNMGLDSWGAEPFTSRGTGIAPVKGSGILFGSSESSYVGNESGSDFEKSTIKNAADRAKETAEITNAGQDKQITIETLYKSMYEDGKPVKVQFDTTSVMPVSVNSVSDSISRKIENITDIFNLLSMFLNSHSNNTNIAGGISSNQSNGFKEIADILNSGLKVNIYDVDYTILKDALSKIINN